MEAVATAREYTSGPPTLYLPEHGRILATADTGRRTTKMLNGTRLLTLWVALVLGAVVVSPLASAEGTSVASSATVKVAFNKELKKSILVDGRGLTLYLYTADYQGKPACYNDATYHCSKAWLPLRTTGAPHAGPGVKASLLGVVKRTDGAAQVTYHGHPLYTDEGPNAFGLTADKKPGDVNGQRFVGIWYVLSPKGNAIH
jgi:predicted lipoprotein with Yx(FWY)xxD motif